MNKYVQAKDKEGMPIGLSEEEIRIKALELATSERRAAHAVQGLLCDAEIIYNWIIQK